MKTIALEIRDEGTHIPVLAIQMLADNETAAYYIHGRCGHPTDGTSIVVMRLYDLKATNDPYEWYSLIGMGRTMPIAHDYIIAHFGKLTDGDVVDVRFIAGEATAPAISDRLRG